MRKTLLMWALVTLTIPTALLAVVVWLVNDINPNYPLSWTIARFLHADPIIQGVAVLLVLLPLVLFLAYFMKRARRTSGHSAGEAVATPRQIPQARLAGIVATRQGRQAETTLALPPLPPPIPPPTLRRAPLPPPIRAPPKAARSFQVVPARPPPTPAPSAPPPPPPAWVNLGPVPQGEVEEQAPASWHDLGPIPTNEPPSTEWLNLGPIDGPAPVDPAHSLGRNTPMRAATKGRTPPKE